MVIHVDAVGATAPARSRAWTADDTMLYALAVGAGPADLDLVTENTVGETLMALPTMAAVLGGGGADLRERLGSWEAARMVHGTQHVELSAPLPPSGEVSVESRVDAVEDKRSGALVEITATATGSGKTLFRSTTGLFIRGEGGFGESRRLSPSSEAGPIPDRPADIVRTEQTSASQALLYRLCGDHNPLHSDPAFAARAGFSRPILHGLCTWGFAGRMLARALPAGVAGVRRFGGRFRSPVLPGDELTAEAWHVADAEWAWRVQVADRTVIDRGVLVEDTE